MSRKDMYFNHRGKDSLIDFREFWENFDIPETASLWLLN
jgi:hypothetical protein